jgi:formylglycine-generating enzyme required for sulfatase activity
MQALIIIIIVILSFGCIGPERQNGTETWINPTDGMVFVMIPAGTMTVRIEDGETPAGELPFQEITIGDFWMSATEVTVAQFRMFAESTGYITEAELAGNRWDWNDPGFVQGEDHPVVYVSFEDAKKYAEWAGGDLPDEAEWLYACHANTETRYYWGDDMRPDLFWHRENSMEGTHPVATNMPNPWGLCDMIGNAKEYCKIIGGGFALRGESWTRCISYKSRHGLIFDQLVAGSIEKILHVHNPDPVLPSYPWDDDTGFRVVRRVE